MKELTKTYGNLLQDRRVKSEQARYENFTRQRSAVLVKYKRVFVAFNDLVDGLLRAQSFYSEIRDNVDSLEKNSEAFVNNRRSEGAELLNQIERDGRSNADGQADRERDRLRDLMERMSTGSNPSNSTMKQSTSATRYAQSSGQHFHTGGVSSHHTPISPPPEHYQPQYQYHNLPQNYVPPPPPPGPPPDGPYYYGPAGGGNSPHVMQAHRQESNNQHAKPTDPWAGLNAWK